MRRKKRPKIKRIGKRRKSVFFLWVLLIISLSFAVYKHFTAIDIHTIIEAQRHENGNGVLRRAFQSRSKKCPSAGRPKWTRCTCADDQVAERATRNSSGLG